MKSLVWKDAKAKMQSLLGTEKVVYAVDFPVSKDVNMAYVSTDKKKVSYEAKILSAEPYEEVKTASKGKKDGEEEIIVKKKQV
jgi:hypothetical protein